MKKPNITEGEWVYNGIGSVVDSDNDTICAIHSMRITPDSKAISAVPEMIDALIVAHNQVLGVCEHNERLNNGLPSKLDRADLKQIEQALKKAGCHE